VEPTEADAGLGTIGGGNHFAELQDWQEIGSAVICEDRELLYEEAPQAYRNSEVVISDMVEAGLIRVVAALKPLITYKVRRPS